MTCSLRPDLWVPGGGGRQQKAESRCPLPTPLSTVISHKPASCSHSHTHSHSHTDPHPHTHAQTYLQTSPQVHQQNTGPHPYPIRHPGRVQGIHAGPRYTYTPGETHVAVLQRTLSGHGLGRSPSLMPPGSLGVGPWSVLGIELCFCTGLSVLSLPCPTQGRGTSNSGPGSPPKCPCLPLHVSREHVSTGMAVREPAVWCVEEPRAVRQFLHWIFSLHHSMTPRWPLEPHE